MICVYYSALCILYRVYCVFYTARKLLLSINIPTLYAVVIQVTFVTIVVIQFTVATIVFIQAEAEVVPSSSLVKLSSVELS